MSSTQFYTFDQTIARLNELGGSRGNFGNDVAGLTYGSGPEYSVFRLGDALGEMKDRIRIPASQVDALLGTGNGNGNLRKRLLDTIRKVGDEGKGLDLSSVQNALHEQRAAIRDSKTLLAKIKAGTQVTIPAVSEFPVLVNTAGAEAAAETAVIKGTAMNKVNVAEWAQQKFGAMGSGLLEDALGSENLWKLEIPQAQADALEERFRVVIAKTKNPTLSGLSLLAGVKEHATGAELSINPARLSYQLASELPKGIDAAGIAQECRVLGLDAEVIAKASHDPEALGVLKTAARATTQITGYGKIRDTFYRSMREHNLDGKNAMVLSQRLGESLGELRDTVTLNHAQIDALAARISTSDTHAGAMAEFIHEIAHTVPEGFSPEIAGKLEVCLADGLAVGLHADSNLPASVAKLRAVLNTETIQHLATNPTALTAAHHQHFPRPEIVKPVVEAAETMSEPATVAAEPVKTTQPALPEPANDAAAPGEPAAVEATQPETPAEPSKPAVAAEPAPVTEPVAKLESVKPAKAAKTETVVEQAEQAAEKVAGGARKWYQMATHNEHGAFSGKRTLAFAAGTIAVTAGGAYLLNRGKDQGPEQASWQDRSSMPGSTTQRAL